MTRLSVPILSDLRDELDLPEELNNVIAQATVPPSAELNALNANLAGLAASAQARADALRRDIELLQQHYLSLKQKVKRDKEKSDRLAAEAAVAELAEADARPEPAAAFDAVARQENGVVKREAESISENSASLRRTGSAEHQLDALLPGQELAGLSQADSPADVEEMKRRLGVAAYPTVDLTPLLPGKPSEDDYTKGKVPNQIAITTFYTSVEPHFRPFTEEDLGWLRDRGDQLGPFIIPPLGPHYSEAWNEMDETPPPKAELSQRPRDSAEQLTDDNVFADAVSCGPLTARLVSAMLKEEGAVQKLEEEEPKDRQPRAAPFKMDYAEVEEKLTGELSFIGLLEATPLDWSQTSDDEISANLRMLQAELKAQSTLNAARKRKLMDLTTDEMARDEYTTILDDLDKQVEQAFLKRTRSIKAKKKRIPGEKGIAVNKVGMGSSMRAQVEKRQKWITKIGSVVKKDCALAPPGFFEDVSLAEEES